MNLGRAANRPDATISAPGGDQADRAPSRRRPHDPTTGTARGTMLSNARRAVGKREKLLGQAARAPHQLRFRDAIWLAEAHGFDHVRTRGSHTMFKSAGFPRLLIFQNVNGLVPAYQVHQLLAAIDARANRSA